MIQSADILKLQNEPAPIFLVKLSGANIPFTWGEKAVAFSLGSKFRLLEHALAITE